MRGMAVFALLAKLDLVICQNVRCSEVLVVHVYTHTQSTKRINVDAAFMRVVVHLSDVVLM